MPWWKKKWEGEEEKAYKKTSKGSNAAIGFRVGSSNQVGLQTKNREKELMIVGRGREKGGRGGKLRL